MKPEIKKAITMLVVAGVTITTIYYGGKGAFYLWKKYRSKKNQESAEKK